MTILLDSLTALGALILIIWTLLILIALIATLRGNVAPCAKCGWPARRSFVRRLCRSCRTRSRHVAGPPAWTARVDARVPTSGRVGRDALITRLSGSRESVPPSGGDAA